MSIYYSIISEMSIPFLKIFSVFLNFFIYISKNVC
nr:MAG TPA: hypothetical protein [Caudoviricetes sp.]